MWSATDEVGPSEPVPQVVVFCSEIRKDSAAEVDDGFDTRTWVDSDWRTRSLNSPRQRIVSMRVIEYSRLIGIPVALNSCVSLLVKNRMSVMTAKTPAKHPVCTAPRMSLRTTVWEPAKPVRDLLKKKSRRPRFDCQGLR